MALTEATITVNLHQLLGGDFDARRTRAYVKTNVVNGTLIDTSTGETRMGDQTVTIADDGTGSFTTWTPGVDGNPTSWQTYLVVEYNRTGQRDRTSRTFGPYTITASGTLASLEDEQAIPAEYQTAFTEQAQSYLDAQAAIAGIDDTDSAVAALLDDALVGPLTQAAGDTYVAGLIDDPASATTSSLSASIASFVAMLPASNGTDDTSVIQAALTAARTAGGGLVKGKPGEHYYTTDSLVIGSNTTLDLTDCTVELKTGNAKNILQSYAFANSVRAVTDAAITASSTTLTSATANFTSADVGRSITVAGAGPNGTGGIPVGPCHLSATISSVTNSTTVVLSVAASTTVSGATATLYNRDSKITLRRGSWISHNSGGSGTHVHHMILCRVDNLVVDLDSFVSDTSGSKYGVYIADATQIDVSIRNMDTISDGLHLQGPIRQGVIRHIAGTSHDDFVAIGAGDNTGLGRQLFTSGDITDLHVEDLRPRNIGTNCAFKLYGLNGQRIERVSLKGVRGDSNPGLISIGAADVQGVYLDQITIEDVHTDRANIATIYANGGRITFSNLSTKYSTAGGVLLAISMQSGFTWDRVTVDRVNLPNAASTAAGGAVVSVAGTITDLDISRCKIPVTASGATLLLSGASASVSRAIIAAVVQSGGGAVVKAATSGQTLGEVWMRDTYITGGSFLADFATTTVLHLSNVEHNSGTSGSLNLRATSNVTVLGHGASKMFGNLSTTAGYALRINCADFSADVSKVTTASAGDRFINSNSSAAPYVSGGIVRDSSGAWIPAGGYAKVGTATLVGGTVTVADTKITASARILLTVLVPGGTVGVPTVSARTAGTSFTITSTSGTDTSVVLYQIVSY